MDETARQTVRARAQNRCEYCRLPQSAGEIFRFHIEHIRSRQHGGGDSLENLALACSNCNWNKGPNLTAVDPITEAITPLFDPRQHEWTEHFATSNLEIVGLSAIGRATVRLLKMNTFDRVEVRRELQNRGEWE
jgi:hypothetical protein